MYAAGKIPGSFFKREGRAGEKATLIARLIDRPLRPLFPKGWRRETQLVNLTLSVDQVHPYDILAMNGASAALMISDIPYPTAVGAVRIGKIEGNFVVNPTDEQLLTADMDLVVAGTDDAAADGRVRRQRGARGRDPRRAGHRAFGDQEADRRAARAAAEGRQGQAGGRGQEGPRGPDRGDRRFPRQGAGRGDLGHRQARAPGRDQGRRGAGARAVLRPGRRARVRRVPPERAARVRRAREEDHPRAHRRPQEAPRRPLRARDPRRSRSTSSRCRARTARRCSRAGRRRRCPSSPSARRARRCAWTTSGSRRPSATSTTTTSRPSRWARPASCAAPSAATSATARSPSARWSR